jgi:hypothetical protein
VFYAGMSAAEKVGRDAGAWFVEADHVSVTALARRRSRARMDEERAKSGRVVIVSSLFLVLFTAALLIGGHAAIDPILQSAVDAALSVAPRTLPEIARIRAGVLPGPPVEPDRIGRVVMRSSLPGPWTAGPLLSVRNESSSQDRDRTDADHVFCLPAGIAGLRVALL